MGGMFPDWMMLLDMKTVTATAILSVCMEYIKKVQSSYYCFQLYDELGLVLLGMTILVL